MLRQYWEIKKSHNTQMSIMGRDIPAVPPEIPVTDRHLEPVTWANVRTYLIQTGSYGVNFRNLSELKTAYSR